jgi:hypothetical protein
MAAYTDHDPRVRRTGHVARDGFVTSSLRGPSRATRAFGKPRDVVGGDFYVFRPNCGRRLARVPAGTWKASTRTHARPAGPMLTQYGVR